MSKRGLAIRSWRQGVMSPAGGCSGSDYLIGRASDHRLKTAKIVATSTFRLPPSTFHFLLSTFNLFYDQICHFNGVHSGFALFH